MCAFGVVTQFSNPLLSYLPHSVHSMELQLTRNESTCTVLAAGSPEIPAPLYHIYTPRSFMSKKPTTISRISSSAAHKPEFQSNNRSDVKASLNADGVEEFASIVWRNWSDNACIVHNGTTTEVNKFMPTHGVLVGYVV